MAVKYCVITGRTGLLKTKSLQFLYKKMILFHFNILKFKYMYKRKKLVSILWNINSKIDGRVHRGFRNCYFANKISWLEPDTSYRWQLSTS